MIPKRSVSGKVHFIASQNRFITKESRKYHLVANYQTDARIFCGWREIGTDSSVVGGGDGGVHAANGNFDIARCITFRTPRLLARKIAPGDASQSPRIN